MKLERLKHTYKVGFGLLSNRAVSVMVYGQAGTETV